MPNPSTPVTPLSGSLTFAQALLSWYHAVKRDLPWRQTHDPYAIWVSEVMLQQTQVKTVIPYYLRFLERFPSPVHLAAAALDEVLTVWRGLGYYSRARHLWEGAGYVVETLHGEIPRTYKALRQIPGIGEYTAGAIASIAFGEAVPAIDGNVRRILSRLLAWPDPVESTLSLRKFQTQLLGWMPSGQTESFLQDQPNHEDQWDFTDNNNLPGDFNQALMELGATVCFPKNPRCSDCPLTAWCQAQAAEDFHYPVKRPKAKPIAVTRLTFVLIQEGRVYLQKRPSEGLLADLWEFPGVEFEPQPKPDRSELVQLKSNIETSVTKVSSGEFRRSCLSQNYTSRRRIESTPTEAECEVLLPLIEVGVSRLDQSENLSLSPEAYFSFYRKAISNRSYDQEALAIFNTFPTLHGPAHHTFSHRHWDLYWFILSIRGHVFPDIVRESPHSVEYRWLSVHELDSAPIPTAFRKVIESCKSR